MSETLTFASAGLTPALEKMLGSATTSTPWNVHLASSGPSTPAFTDVVGAYTESTEAGYASVPLTYASYTFSVSSPNVIGTYINFSFTFTAAFATVTHVYVTDSTNAFLIGGDKLATPNVSGTAGGTININGLAFALS